MTQATRITRPNTGLPTVTQPTAWQTLALLPGQQAIWLADQLSDSDHVYAISHCVELRGQLHADCLQQAIILGLAEADTVNARYPQQLQHNARTPAEVACQQYRQITPTADVKAPQWLDARNLPASAVNPPADLSDAQLRQRAFDWMWAQSQQPCTVALPDSLQQQVIIRLPDNEQGQHWLWFQKFHHLMLDGFSFTALTRRIGVIYQHLLNQQPLSPSPYTALPKVLQEYQEYATSAACQQNKAFWLNDCANASPVYSLSRQGPATDLPSAAIVSHQQWLPDNLLPQLRALGEQLGSGLKASQKPAQSDWIMAWLAAYLARYTGLKRHRVGIPFMRRLGSVAVSSLAPVVNVLPVQLDIEDDCDWLTLACQLRQRLKTIRQHQRYEGDQILRDYQQASRDKPSSGSHKLYGPLLNYKLFDFELPLPAASAETHHLATGPIDDFEFGILVHGERILLELRAEAGRYEQSELQEHGARLQQLLQFWLQQPHTGVQSLPLLTDHEQQQLQDWSSGPTLQPAPQQHSILDELFEQLAAHPQQIAVRCQQQALNSAQLQERIQQLSHYLIAQGCGPGTVVGVAIPRSIDTLVAMLAVLNSGATFMPLDLDYPAERLAMMCEDASPGLILSRSDVPDVLPGSLPVHCLDQLGAALAQQPQHRVSDQQRLTPLRRHHLAYVIFTSGSTGRPKGVMNSHGALLNLLTSHRHSIYGPALAQQQQRYPGRPLNAAHTHSFSFDSSWLQLFWLVLGQTLVIFDEQERRDAFGLAAAIRDQQLDAFDLPPSFCIQLLKVLEQQNTGQPDAHWPTLILIGGEAAPAALWQQFRQLHQQHGLQSHNLYGPTEYTVDTLRAEPPQHPAPVIGRPLANTRVYVLDSRLRPVPAGVTGELYLAGAGLADGYIGRADLSASRFVANPFASQPGQRMYRSGDLVRWSPQGQLEYQGRSDDQIKIRGYRVEIGEVENALSLLPGIDSSIVMAEAIHNSQRLVAWCVPSDPAALASNGALALSRQWLQQLQQQLPDYMVPSCLLVLADFPRNVSGKIDRKALPGAEQWQAQQAALNRDTSSTTSNDNPALQALLQAAANLLQLPALQPEDDFFMIGGDSISAILLCAELAQQGWQLQPAQIFTLRQMDAISQQLQALPRPSHASAPDSNRPEPTPGWRCPADDWRQLQQRYGNDIEVATLLPLQRGMLFQTRMAEAQGHPGYNAFTRIRFSGPLDPQRLQQALNQLLLDYPQLTGLFDSQSLDNAVFVQPRHTDLLYWPMMVSDLSALPEAQRRIEQARQEQTQLQTAMATDAFGGMIRAQLFRHSDQHWQLLLMVHHLLIDGWSSPILLRRLCDRYRDQQQVEPLPAQLDYRALVNQLAARDPQPAREHWRQQLANATPTLLFEEQVSDQQAVSEHQLTLPAPQLQQLQQQLRQRGVTLNALMQGLWALALQSLCGRDELIFGTPVSGRHSGLAGLQQAVGLFLNTLPVRIQLDARQSLWQQLPGIQQQHLHNLQYDQLGLADIQQLAGHKRLFDTLLVVENYPDNHYLSQPLNRRDEPELAISALDNRGYSHYPLALLVIPDQGLTLLLENRSALSTPQAESLLQLLEYWLLDLLEVTSENAITARNHRVSQPGFSQLPLCRWPLLTPAQQHWIDRQNQTRHAVPSTSLQALLRQQAWQSPSAPALSDDQYSLSYGEVRQQVVALARQLNQQGVRPGAIVAIALPRTVVLSISILAVIEAGAAYLPMELDYPDQRLAIMLEDSAAVRLITTPAQQPRFAELQQAHQLDIPMQLLPALPTPSTLGISVEQALYAEPLKPVDPQQPAYLIFTSGTTGRPKGVLVPHQAIVNRLLWMQHQYPLTPEDVVLQKTPCSFDVSVWEFFWSYLVGARLVMAAPDVHKDPQQLASTIEHFGVTTLHFVPSMLALFTASHRDQAISSGTPCRSLRQVFCSGEALTKTQARNFAEVFDAELHNLYGPTEAAVDVTWQPAFGEGLQAGGAGVAIGRPVWNTELRILDQYLRPVAPGASGELYLCGEQLAHGYLGRPDLSASRFVADPWGTPGSRMYRTGDLARWLPEGEVEYLGRSDDQIKIRGQRLELGEIESRLRQQPEVANAVVHAVQLGQDADSGMDSRQLVCWLIARPQAQHSHELTLEQLGQQLRQRLAATLPAHMVPVAVVWMDSLPLSPNGKLDRKALPLPALANTGHTPRRAPAAGLETRLAQLFEQLLGRSVGVDDDFFAIGGHSLLAMQLAAQIRKQLRRDVSVGQILLNPTVAALAEQLNADVMLNDFGQQGFAEVLPLRKANGPQLLCVYPGSGFAWQYSVLSRYLDPQWSITGLQSPRPHGLIASSATMEQLIDGQLQRIRQLQPRGPYYLLGYSLGGTIAWHLAARLRSEGEEVAFLGLLDTYPAEVHDWNDPAGDEASAGAEREQQQLLTDAMDADNSDASSTDPVSQAARRERDAMLSQIFANYQDAVRLLASTRTPTCKGNAHLFIACDGLPEYIDPGNDWTPYIDSPSSLQLHPLATSHEAILAPTSLQTLGPLLNRLLQKALAETSASHTASATTLATATGIRHP